MKLPGAARDSAIALIEEGNALENQGRMSEAMARYDAAVQLDSSCARAHLNRGNALLAGARIDEARCAYETAIACDRLYAAAHYNLGNLNTRAGDYRSALQNYQDAVGIKADFAIAFVAMGNVLDVLGRAAEARASYERALGIDPEDAGVHFNLGQMAMAEGRYEQAIASLSRAIELHPDYAAAHHALGKLFSNLGNLDAAEASLRRAFSGAPESAEILYDLAVFLVGRARAPEAVQLALRGLERTPTRWPAKIAFAHAVRNTRFLTTDSRVRVALTTAITEAWTTPFQLCWPALSLIMTDPTIAACVRIANEQWPRRPSKTELFGARGLATLSADALLHVVLQTVPVTTIEFERFLTAARRALLETVSSEPPHASDLAALPFYAALARQCFINEYIFDFDDGEQTAAAACRARLEALLDAEAVAPPLLVLAVAAYIPLHTLPAASRLLAATQPGPVHDLLRQQVREPLEEQALRAGVACLTSIAHGVSKTVRDQYEENPYPRWVKVPMQESELHLNRQLQRTLPLARFVPMQDDRHPEMLIAGCGTGSQPILASRRFQGVRVLAVDLSLSSISYALRKTRELGIGNIEYAQADILKLGEITRTFDIIASVGVLHHLADPFAGWRTLLSRLRRGGFMHLGFYSQIARRHVVKARELVAARGYAGTPAGIRRFRRELAAGDADAELQWLSQMADFYSTSECRDLIFHVQEQCLTLDQIGSFIAESGLNFLGFELDLRVLLQYRASFPGDPAGTNLHNWARFEADHPDTFSAMYVFWIQKPPGD